MSYFWVRLGRACLVGHLRVARADREAVFPTLPPPRIIAGVNVLGVGAGRNSGC